MSSKKLDINKNCKFEALGKLIHITYQIENDGPNVYNNFLK